MSVKTTALKHFVHDIATCQSSIYNMLKFFCNWSNTQNILQVLILNKNLPQELYPDGWINHSYIADEFQIEQNVLPVP